MSASPARSHLSKKRALASAVRVLRGDGAGLAEKREDGRD
jgi:hypothetical protein